MFTQAFSLLLPNEAQYLGLSLYAKIFDSNGVQVGTPIYASFYEAGRGNYTLVYNNFPDNFFGTVSFFNNANDEFLASCEVNANSEPLFPFSIADAFVRRQSNIRIYAGTLSTFVWRKNVVTTPQEITFTIKYDMTNSPQDAMLVVTLTNGCEVVLGEPATNSASAAITFDDNFIYCVLTPELTVQFTSQFGYQEYDVIADNFEQAYGNCSVILSGVSNV